MIVVLYLSVLELEEAVAAGNICFPRLQLQPLQSGYRSATHDHDYQSTCLCPMTVPWAPQQNSSAVRAPGTLSPQIYSLWTRLLIFEL